MADKRPILGVTLGDPAGIGPEVTVKALAHNGIYDFCRPLVLGDMGAIKKAMAFCGLSLPVVERDSVRTAEGKPGQVEVLPLSRLRDDDLTPGRPTPDGGLAAARYIETGARLALDGEIHALVTSPISKEALNRAGYMFPGHTELLAHMAGNPPVVMMLAGKRLRVVLVTIHQALSDVPGLVTREKILETTRITHECLRRYFSMPKPRVAVAALNPHAGETNMFGREETDIISPAVHELEQEGIDVSGPYPPDTLFYRAVQGEFDVVVCMYHDQGLIPFKLLHFKDGVNVTLGLPFIRTSVDHGTAYELAGRNLADHQSMLSALKMAADMAKAGGKVTG
jgi:4-hydroxythreonine-4-phosphate dehydrogenase